MKYIVLDTETTGLNTKKDRIIEISCIELNNYKITGRYFHTYLNTKRKISKSAFKIHGINKKKINNKPYFKDIALKLKKILESYTVIIHNSIFDYSIIKKEYKRLNTRISFKVIDTLKICRNIFPGKKNNLRSLCGRFRLNLPHKHSAFYDSLNLAKIFVIINKKQKKLPLHIKETSINKLDKKNKKKLILFDTLVS
ncbi:exonuclease domain-containing protein [Candidatus Vidania fulgoroideorum]